MPKSALLLTAWYFPIRVVPWQTAIKMIFEETVDTLAAYEETVSSPSVTWHVPAVIRLRHKTPHQKRAVKYSDHNVKLRDRFTCQYCGERLERSELTMDHVIPRSQGGARTFKNIVAACKPCNHKKANLSCDEAGMFPRNQPVVPNSLPIDMVAVRAGRVPEEWAPYLEAFNLA
jgi:5-methylcytosine-specific restriction endonuclease McrA